MSVGRRQAVVRSALATTVLAGVVVALRAAGGPRLATPRLDSWQELERWYTAAGPEVAVVTIVRACGLVLAAWLLLGAALELVAAVRGDQLSRAIADLIAPRSLRRVVHGLAGLSLTAGLAVAVPGAGIPAAARAAADHGPTVEHPPDAPGTATMRPLPAPDRRAPAVPAAEPARPAPVAAPPVPAQPAPPSPSGAVVVEPGDSFWSISAELLTDVLGRAPAEREIAAHWRRLVDANRQRLVDPANPDLLYPGQELVLPELA